MLIVVYIRRHKYCRVPPKFPLLNPNRSVYIRRHAMTARPTAQTTASQTGLVPYDRRYRLWWHALCSILRCDPQTCLEVPCVSRTRARRYIVREAMASGILPTNPRSRCYCRGIWYPTVYICIMLYIPRAYLAYCDLNPEDAIIHSSPDVVVD